MLRKCFQSFVLLFWLILTILSIPVLLERAKPVSAYWIAYSESVNGNRDIYIRSLFDGKCIRLTHDPADDYLPQWSPDGKWIAFLRETDGDWSMHVVRIGSVTTRTMWTCEDTNCYHPQVKWSGDSKFLDIQRNAVRVRDGKQLFSDVPKQNLNRVDWSPNGQWRTLIFGDEVFVDGQLYIQNLAQETHTLLVDLTVVSDWIEFSSDNQWVYFMAVLGDDFNVVDIFRVRPDGSDLQNITNMGIDRFANPLFIEEGELISFEAWSDDTCCADRQRHYFSVPRDGGFIEEGGTTNIEFTYSNTSPNGEWIIWERNSAYGPLRYVNNRMTSQQYNLGGAGAIISISEWSPDSRYVAYEIGNIHLLDVEEGIDVVVPFGLRSAQWSPDGRWLIGNTDHNTVIQVSAALDSYRTIFSVEPDNRGFGIYDLSPELEIGMLESDSTLLYLKFYSIILGILISIPHLILRRLSSPSAPNNP